MRACGQRLRTAHPVRRLSSRRDLWRRRSTRGLRLSGVQEEDLRRAGQELRSGGRRLRRHPGLRRLRTSSDLRRRRYAERVRRQRTEVDEQEHEQPRGTSHPTELAPPLKRWAYATQEQGSTKARIRTDHVYVHVHDHDHERVSDAYRTRSDALQMPSETIRKAFSRQI